jgi:hypothetical protein
LLSIFQCWLHPAVITECIERCRWNGILSSLGGSS